MELMKNGLAQPAVTRISHALTKVLVNFNAQAFESDCLQGLNELELKERVNHIISILHDYLPDEFPEAANILIKIADVWDFGNADDSLKSFAAWPIIDYFSVYGLEHPEESLLGLKQLTHLFSSEFAIRAFIVKYPEYCHQQFTLWVKDESEDVRRLVSEGTRPKLPWGLQLKQFVVDPTPNLPLLTSLKSDPSLYVRRSVANHLNDIAKDHPAVVINTCKQWSNEKTKSNAKEVDWVIKHATRTLVKNGYAEVFSLLGFTEAPEVSIDAIVLSNQVIKLGEAVSFAMNISSTVQHAQHFVIDYAIHFVKANGKQQAKVFKLKNVTLQPNETIKLSKSFSFKPITTRKYYIGEHKIELLLNGKPISAKSFDLVSS
ncbi:DNA alkylation repair protein [Pseudocolwellia sp. HL-MZ19]|uniref:DNA alkylation repair protein n=1 Tax=unclassified Pseudocolwellia TaxID=2848178 RepID=UPI003CF974E0